MIELDTKKTEPDDPFGKDSCNGRSKHIFSSKKNFTAVLNGFTANVFEFEVFENCDSKYIHGDISLLTPEKSVLKKPFELTIYKETNRVATIRGAKFTSILREYDFVEKCVVEARYISSGMEIFDASRQTHL